MLFILNESNLSLDEGLCKIQHPQSSVALMDYLGAIIETTKIKAAIESSSSKIGFLKKPTPHYSCSVSVVKIFEKCL